MLIPLILMKLTVTPNQNMLRLHRSLSNTSSVCPSLCVCNCMRHANPCPILCFLTAFCWIHNCIFKPLVIPCTLRFSTTKWILGKMSSCHFNRRHISDSYSTFASKQRHLCCNGITATPFSYSLSEPTVFGVALGSEFGSRPKCCDIWGNGHIVNEDGLLFSQPIKPTNTCMFAHESSSGTAFYITLLLSCVWTRRNCGQNIVF